MLSGCSLGYRARYLSETARLVANDPGWEERIAALPYRKARAELLRLRGVGKKVADCVLLFAFGKWEAFPVDVWIERIVKGCYPECRDFRTYDQIGEFGRSHFGRYAGYAQEYLFCYRGASRDGGIRRERGALEPVQVPDSQPERYFSWDSVSSSMERPSDASFLAATVSSISVGTSWTPGFISRPLVTMWRAQRACRENSGPSPRSGAHPFGRQG